MNLFVSNIDYSIGEDDLKEIFSECGEVNSVKIIIDLETKKSKGFGFIDMADEAGGQKAIDELDKAELNNRPISVQKAKPRPTGDTKKPTFTKNTGSGERKLRPRIKRNIE